MNQEALKQAVAQTALHYVPENSFIGIGTGSTVNYFIDLLATKKHLIQGTVASSKATEARLKEKGIPVFPLNAVDEITLYFDSADACNPHRQLVKGGKGALTQEKILAAVSQQFLCMIDETKLVKFFGAVPIPVEVIPMARSFVARQILKLQGTPVYRDSFITDNGNIILDVHDWHLAQPIKMEEALNNIPGVVSCGLFANHPADKVLLATKSGVKVL
jgi:ribose 5-phosphate isomerase A